MTNGTPKKEDMDGGPHIKNLTMELQINKIKYR